MYYKLINNIRWYYRLKPQKELNGYVKMGLFSEHPRNTLSNSLIVALSYFDSTSNKTYRLYGKFKSYLEFGIYQIKLPQRERCFYEIILGESSQKPHFDLDIDNTYIDGEAVKDNLIDNIIKVLNTINLKLKTDILVYTSHGVKKQSYHIIINNYCHANNIEARAFYDKVVNNINPNYIQWIDRAVYSPTQQFRIVGSQKIGTYRVKIFQNKWSYHSDTIIHKYPEDPDSPEHEMIMQLESSIIGYTGNCRFLPVFEPKPETIKNYSDTEDITIDDAVEGIKLIANAGKISVNDVRFPYKFMGIDGPIVMLKRIKSSRCKLCNRIHEHENPYLLIIGEEKNVYFFCRRAPQNKKLYLGKLIMNINNNINVNVFNNNKTGHWTQNVIDRVQKLARTNIGKTKQYVNGETEIDPIHKQMIIDNYLKIDKIKN